MLDTVRAPLLARSAASGRANDVVVIWIDWYAYHLARFRGLLTHPELADRVFGLEMVGGMGVHAGLNFREQLPSELPIETLRPALHWKEAGQLSLALAMWKRLRELNPTTVLVPGYYTLPALAAALWARVHGRKSVLMTESTQHDHRRSWWKEKLKSLLIRNLFDWAVAGGVPHAWYLRQLGFPADRIAGFYDVVDNDGYRDQCSALRQHGRRPAKLPEHYFLYVGRLAAEKNIQGLIGAYLSYRAAGGNWSLVLVGGGPQEAKLRAMLHASPFADDVHLIGHTASRDIAQYFAFAETFLLPSTREPWGLVVNEAMASGLPVIVSSRCGCVEDLVCHGRNGFVFDPTAEDELPKYLRQMESLGEEARLTMGRESSMRISAYSPKQFAAEVSRVVAA